MSVLIKDMEKPKSCYAVIDGEYEYCPFVNTDDDCVLLLKKGICEGTWEKQYSKCPLVEAPEPHDAAKRLNDLIFDIHPAEICSQIESDNLKQLCKTIQTEMRMAMVQLPCWTEKEKA